MANNNAPFGFKPVRNAFSGPYNDGAQPYAAAAGDSVVIRYGDPVTLTGAATADGVPYVALSTAGGTTNFVTGIAVGFRPVGTTEWLGYRPASVEYEVLVEDNPNSEFFIMEDSVGGAVAVASVGLNAQIVFGSATGNISAAMLDSSTAATTATHQLRILGLAQIVNNAQGNYAVWRVRLNMHTHAPAIAGA
jgi:hypothetical protein